MDPRFKVEVIASTPNPQQLAYAAMHQDYAEGFVNDHRDRWPTEEKAGDLLVKHLLQGNRGHYGPLEHPQIIFNFGYFPHSVMQQVRTHRNVSFDVQCLAADTEITFVNKQGQTGPTLKRTIGELFDLWANGEKAVRQRHIRGRKGEPAGEYRRDCKNRIRKMRLRVLNEESGRFEIGHIKDVMCSGLQPVYRLTLENGRTLDCTANHRLFTAQGWQRMEQALNLSLNADGTVLSWSDCALMCNGSAVAGTGQYRDRQWLAQHVAQGLTLQEIANKAGCSKTTVCDWLKHHQLELSTDGRFRPGQSPWNDRPDARYRDRQWLESCLQQGLHIDEMAQLADCSIEAIKKWTYTYGLKINKRLSGTRNPWNKGKSGYRLSLSPEQLQSRRERSLTFTRRGKDSNFWRGGTASDRETIGAWTRQIAPQVHEKFDYVCQKCGERGGELHAHHLVPVFADVTKSYEFDNLVSLCKDCHNFIHHHHLELEFAQYFQPLTIDKTAWSTKPRSLVPHPVSVVAVDYLGVQMTYDLEVEGSWHNFVANGIVVHNSFRYTGSRILDVVAGKEALEDVFYLRPVGFYSDRQGKKYDYTQAQRQEDLDWCLQGCQRYAERIQQGLAEEHARGLIPFDVRQHWVMSGNARAIMHLLDIRGKFDVQPETRVMTEMMLEHFRTWMPQISVWYEKNRWRKGTLAP